MAGPVHPRRHPVALAAQPAAEAVRGNADYAGQWLPSDIAVYLTVFNLPRSLYASPFHSVTLKWSPVASKSGSVPFRSRIRGITLRRMPMPRSSISP